MTINPNAIATKGTCKGCGDPIEAWYVVCLCDPCLQRVKAEGWGWVKEAIAREGKEQ